MVTPGDWVKEMSEALANVVFLMTDGAPKWLICRVRSSLIHFRDHMSTFLAGHGTTKSPV